MLLRRPGLLRVLLLRRRGVLRCGFGRLLMSSRSVALLALFLAVGGNYSSQKEHECGYRNREFHEFHLE